MSQQLASDLSAALLDASPQQIIDEAVSRFGARLGLALGFGIEGCVLLDMISERGHAIDVFTLDTGLLFEETYALWRRLEARYDLRVRAVCPERTVAEQQAEYGPALWERDPDRCCALRKLLPLRQALAGKSAYLSGVRRGQTRERDHLLPAMYDERFRVLKLAPLWRLSEQEVWRYALERGVPYNPLHDAGYPSIGCAPCTGPVAPGEDPRAGRWRGRGKTECGLHAASTLPVHMEEK